MPTNLQLLAEVNSSLWYKILELIIDFIFWLQFEIPSGILLYSWQNCVFVENNSILYKEDWIYFVLGRLILGENVYMYIAEDIKLLKRKAYN